MKNFRINCVETDIPLEFFFFQILPEMGEFEALSNISITFISLYPRSRKLDDGRDYKDSFHFVSFAQFLRDYPIDESFESLSDKEFSQKMRIRFEKARQEAFDRISSLFQIESRERIFEVFEDFRTKVKVGKEEKPFWVSVPVGLAVAPKNTRPF